MVHFAVCVVVCVQMVPKRREQAKLLTKLTHHSLTVIDHDYNNTVLYVLFEVSYMILCSLYLYCCKQLSLNVYLKVPYMLYVETCAIITHIFTSIPSVVLALYTHCPLSKPIDVYT